MKTYEYDNALHTESRVPIKNTLLAVAGLIGYILCFLVLLTGDSSLSIKATGFALTLTGITYLGVSWFEMDRLISKADILTRGFGDMENKLARLDQENQDHAKSLFAMTKQNDDREAMYEQLQKNLTLSSESCVRLRKELEAAGNVVEQLNKLQEEFDALEERYFILGKSNSETVLTLDLRLNDIQYLENKLKTETEAHQNTNAGLSQAHRGLEILIDEFDKVKETLRQCVQENNELRSKTSTPTARRVNQKNNKREDNSTNGKAKNTGRTRRGNDSGDRERVGDEVSTDSPSPVAKVGS